MKQLNFGSTNRVPNDPNKTVVHCPTQELAQKVLRIADSEGYKWSDGDSYLDVSNWGTFKDATCYSFSKGVFLTRSTYSNSGFTILPAEEFIRLNTPDAEVRNPFRVGDRVYCCFKGWGLVKYIDNTLSYPIRVLFDSSGLVEGYTTDGRWKNDSNPTLSFTEYTLQGFSQERPKELDFDASCLPSWANKFIAMDDGGQWYGFLYIPKINRSVWYGNECCEIPSDFAPKNFTGSWSDSLHEIKDGKAVKYSPKTAEEK